MPFTLLSPPRHRELTSSGAVEPGAKLYFYVSGTTTAATTYQNAAGTVAHSNPVVADTGGLFPAIWLDDQVVYDCTMKTLAGSTKWTVRGLEGTAGDILQLTSRQTSSPFSETYVEFLEDADTRKGLVGYPTGNPMLVSTNKTAGIFVQSGNAAQDAGVNRASFTGTDTNSIFSIICQGATALGGGIIKFIVGSTAAAKAVLGFASEADNDFDIDNQVSGGHIEFKTAGTGRIRMPLASGSASAPMISVTGDTNTGIYSAGADQLNISTGGVERVAVGSTATYIANRLDIGGAAGLLFSSSGNKILDLNTTDMALAPGGTVVCVVKANGAFKFQGISAPTGTPENGDVYYDTDTDKLMVRAAGAWVALH